jgi:hypothetical protein
MQFSNMVTNFSNSATLFKANTNSQLRNEKIQYINNLNSNTWLKVEIEKIYIHL